MEAPIYIYSDTEEEANAAAAAAAGSTDPKLAADPVSADYVVAAEKTFPSKKRARPRKSSPSAPKPKRAKPNAPDAAGTQDALRGLASETGVVGPSQLVLPAIKFEGNVARLAPLQHHGGVVAPQRALSADSFYTRVAHKLDSIRLGQARKVDFSLFYAAIKQIMTTNPVRHSFEWFQYIRYARRWLTANRVVGLVIDHVDNAASIELMCGIFSTGSTLMDDTGLQIYIGDFKLSNLEAQSRVIHRRLVAEEECRWFWDRLDAVVNPQLSVVILCSYTGRQGAEDPMYAFLARHAATLVEIELRGVVVENTDWLLGLHPRHLVFTSVYTVRRHRNAWYHESEVDTDSGYDGWMKKWYSAGRKAMAAAAAAAATPAASTAPGSDAAQTTTCSLTISFGDELDADSKTLTTTPLFDASEIGAFYGYFVHLRPTAPVFIRDVRHIDCIATSHLDGSVYFKMININPVHSAGITIASAHAASLPFCYASEVVLDKISLVYTMPSYTATKRRMDQFHFELKSEMACLGNKWKIWPSKDISRLTLQLFWPRLMNLELPNIDMTIAVFKEMAACTSIETHASCTMTIKTNMRVEEQNNNFKFNQSLKTDSLVHSMAKWTRNGERRTTLIFSFPYWGLKQPSLSKLPQSVALLQQSFDDSNRHVCDNMMKITSDIQVSDRLVTVDNLPLYKLIWDRSAPPAAEAATPAVVAVEQRVEPSDEQQETTSGSVSHEISAPAETPPLLSAQKENVSVKIESAELVLAAEPRQFEIAL